MYSGGAYYVVTSRHDFDCSAISIIRKGTPILKCEDVIDGDIVISKEPINTESILSLIQYDQRVQLVGLNTIQVDRLITATPGTGFKVALNDMLRKPKPYGSNTEHNFSAVDTFQFTANANQMVYIEGRESLCTIEITNNMSRMSIAYFIMKIPGAIGFLPTGVNIYLKFKPFGYYTSNSIIYTPETIKIFEPPIVSSLPF